MLGRRRDPETDIRSSANRADAARPRGFALRMRGTVMSTMVLRAAASGLAGLLVAIAAALILSARPDPAGASPARADASLRAERRAAASCDAAIARAAARHGVPERLLRAIALVESGRGVDGARRPWPWTVNMEGEGRWFDDRAEALAFVRARQAAGARSFDLGCMQVNHRWHGEAFSSLEEMIDPGANADYAARYLKALREETGDWRRAAGYYHSRTPRHFERYSRLFEAAYAALADVPAPRAWAEAGRDAGPIRPAPRWDGLLPLGAGLSLLRDAAPLLRPVRVASAGGGRGGIMFAAVEGPPDADPPPRAASPIGSGGRVHSHASPTTAGPPGGLVRDGATPLLRGGGASLFSPNPL